MIPASPEFKNILRTALEVSGDLRLLAEWNMNRFYTPVVTNNDEASRDDFPLSSVVEPLRPTKKGIVKILVGEGIVQPQYMNSVPNARYYLTSGDDLYHYWSSQQTADTLSGSGNSYSFATPQRLTVIYPNPIYTNKIVVGLETSLSSPVSYSVQVTTNGTSWTTAAVNPAINSDGQVALYLQQNGSWGAVPYYKNITTIRGVRLVVNTMSEAFSRLSVIEISPRIHNDLSEFLESWDASFELSDVSDLTPIGRASSNVASVVLSNVDQRFSNDNSESLYFGIIDKNVKMTLDFGLKLASGAYEYVRQFTMYTDSFAPSSDMNVTAGLTDSSTYLQTIIIPSLYMENHTVGAIIWKLMDIAGFTNYYYNVKEDDSQVVPYFWTTGEESLWDVIAGLAETTQTAVYFDENDVMRIQTKSAAFDITRAIAPADWDLRATSAPGLIANIIDLDQDRVFETNSLDVTYYDTKFSDFNNGFPKMEVSWEPEGTMVLRAATIIKPIVAGSEYVTIDQEKSTTWPYSGIVNIEGEMIRYEGKHYYYYDRAGSLKEEIVTSQDQKDALDHPPMPPGAEFDDYTPWRNHFSGNLKIVERGYLNTTISDHVIYSFDPGAPGPRYVGAYINWTNFSGINFYSRAWFQNNNGHLTLRTDASYSFVDTHLVHNGLTQDLVFQGNFGTRVRLTSAGVPENQGVGGLYLCGGNAGQGLFVGIHPTAVVEGAGRPHHEVCTYVKGTSGVTTLLGQTQANIDKDVWYDLEARVEVITGDHYRISVYLNGAHMGTYGVPLGHFENLGRTGVWIRSNCAADFEYLYAFEDDQPGADDPENRDSPGGRTMDLIYGGYRSNTIYNRIKYNWIWSAWDHQYRLVGSFFFDEFTPVVHEVREIEAGFKDAPVLHSYPLMTNESQAMILEYNADPFRGKMMIANAARVDAVVNGEDKVTFGPDDPVNHTLLIYGRLLTQEDAQHSTTKNDNSIRTRGLVETQIDSKWIQSEEAAESISAWAINTFGNGADEVTAEIFANPILQVGDLVTVSHPGFHMSTATHKYFVTSINKSWDQGLICSVGLKRIKI